MKKIFSCFAIVFLISSSLAFAFDDKRSHPSFTETAVGHSILEDTLIANLGIERGIGTRLSDRIDTFAIIDWLKRGAELEDDPRCRASNHFHDPTKPWPEAMLTDSTWYLNLYCGTSRYSNLVWATGMVDENQTPLHPPVNNDSNINNGRNWSVARDLFYHALTSSSQVEREHYLAGTFLTLGHVLHLLQDMAVPAHTRNDFSQGHIQVIGCPGGFCLSGWIGNPFEGYVRDNFDLIDEEISIISKPFTGERVLTNFWDTGSVRSSNSYQTGFDIGLAEYSNTNFVSHSTIFQDESNTNHYFPYPNRESVADPAYPELADYRLHQVWARDDQLDQVIYVAKNNHGEKIDKFLKPRYLKFGGGWPDNPPLYRLAFTLDDQCYLEYAKRLIPRAIGYSASLLDYFFRGRIDIKSPLQLIGPDSSITGLSFAMKNSTAPIEAGWNVEPMTEGKIELAYSYKLPDHRDPFFRRVGQAIYVISGPADAINYGYVPVTVNLPENVPANAYDFTFTVVFNGTLGNEAGAVAAQVYQFDNTRLAYFHQPGGQPNTSNIMVISPSGAHPYPVTDATTPNPWYFGSSAKSVGKLRHG
ncbi:hypothetical protein ACHHRT_06165 [Desulfurivibrio sp. D14AmB]|uniref:hypothetical protein n=1 Tax=Desulfurivibrio sp. D14AmB TaxID=3374370 RepID=UPI00376EE340